MFNEIIKHIKQIYMVNKHNILKELNKINNIFTPKESYVSACEMMIDDFFVNTESHEISHILNYTTDEIIKYISITAFWIIDKYVEDESLLLHELLEYDKTLERKAVLDFEVMMFSNVNKLRKYIK